MRRLFLVIVLVLSVGVFSQNVEIYPKDIDSICHVKADVNVFNVSIHNMEGKIMINREYNGDNSSWFKMWYDFRGYPKGRYIVSVKTDKGIFEKIVSWLMPRAKQKKK